MPLQFRKGTDGQRQTITPAQGEPIWTTDNHQLWVGDGVTTGGILIAGTGSGGGGFASTSSISAGGNKLQINVDGSLAFPLNNTLVSTQTFKISTLGTTATFNSQGVIIANPATTTGAATLLINDSTATTFAAPNLDGTAVWAVGKDGQSTRILTDNYGAGQNTWIGRDANGSATAPTAVTTGGVMLRVGGLGYGATGFGTTQSTFIDFVATEKLNDFAKGGGLNINTVNQGTLIANTSMNVTSKGVQIFASQTNTNYGPLFVNASPSWVPPAGQGDTIIYGVQRNNSKGRVTVDTYSNTGTDSIANMSTIFTGRRARGTIASPQAVKSGDILNRLNGFGYDGTKFATSASGYVAIGAAEDLKPTGFGGYVEIGVINTGTTNTVITAVFDQGGLTLQRSLQVNVDIDSIGDITTQNNVFANNNISAGKNLYVDQNAYISGTELVGGQLTAGSIVSNSTIDASTNITAGGNITATGDITGNDVTATGNVTVSGYVYAQGAIHSGAYLYSNGKVSATTFVSAGTDITAGRNITAVGDITGNDFTASGTITAVGAVSGASVSATGNVTAGATLQGADLTVTALASVTTTNYLFYNTLTGAITYGPDIEMNPFNQTLNTYDSPTFASLTLNGSLNASTWTYAGSSVGLTANSLNIKTSPGATASTIFINESGSSSYVGVNSSPSLWAINNTGGYGARVMLDTYDTTQSSFYTGRRARGTAGSPTAVQSGDTLNRLNAFGYGATGFNSNSAAYVNLYAKENFTDTAMGGQIVLGTMTPGTTTQVNRLTVDDNGLLVNGDVLPSGTQNIGASGTPWSNIYGSTVRTTTLTFADATSQTTAWTGSVSTSTVTGLKTIAWTGKLSDGTGQISTSTVAGLSTIGFTGKLSDATGSISTSQVNGLSVVGYTNNYNDLTNLPSLPNQSLNTFSSPTFQGLTITGTNITISGTLPASASYNSLVLAPTNRVSVQQFTDQNLFTTSSVAFAGISNAGSLTTGPLSVTGQSTLVGGLSVSTGTLISKSLSVNGIPLNAAGTFTNFFLTTGNSPAMMVSNYVAGNPLPALIVRGYGQNIPGGGAATVPNPNLRLQTALGTSASPTAVPASTNLGGILVDGYDGLNWASDTGSSPNFLGWFSSEAYTNNGSTTTYQAGSSFNIYVQPQWTRPGINATRQRFIINSWTTSTTGPSQLNLGIGSGVDSTAPTMTMVDGTTYTGYGRTNLNFINAATSISGVPAQDTAPDNATLTGTNTLQIIGARRSSVSGRRNALAVNDDLGSIQFRGQNTNNSTGNGVRGAVVSVTALDAFTSTAYGSQINIRTVNSGTIVEQQRMTITDAVMRYNSDSHVFADKTGVFTALSLNTSSAVFSKGVTIGNPGLTMPGDGQIQQYAWQPGWLSAYDTTTQTAANTTNLNLVNIGSVSTASQVTLASNGAVVTAAGVYNIQLSIQFSNSDNANQDVVVWLRQNSTDVADSAGVVTVPAKSGTVNGKTIASWNYVVQAAASDAFYLYWQPQNTGVTIATQTVGTGTPRSPGVIYTVTRVR